MSTKVKEIKAKMNKWDLIKLENLCTAKEIINKMKKPSTEWEEMFANYMTNTVLISNIYKQFIQLNIKKKIKQTTQLKNGQNRRVSKEDIQVTKRHMKRGSAPLTIRETQIKTTMSDHLTPVGMAITRRNTNYKCW